MVRKYRTKPQRIEAFRITLAMLGGTEEWPVDMRDYGIADQLLTAGDYVFRAYPGGHWECRGSNWFEEHFEEERIATLHSIQGK